MLTDRNIRYIKYTSNNGKIKNKIKIYKSKKVKFNIKLNLYLTLKYNLCNNMISKNIRSSCIRITEYLKRTTLLLLAN